MEWLCGLVKPIALYLLKNSLIFNMDETALQNLANENERLKARLEDYKKLEEELLAERVYKKAKDKLLQWYSIGGIALFISGIWGIREIVVYMENRADTAVTQVTKDQVAKIVQQSAEKNTLKYINSIEDSLNLVVKQKIAEINISNNPLKGVSKNDSVFVNQNTVINLHSIDLSTDMNPVRNSGDEGSVVGFAIGAAMEYMIYRHDFKKIELSPRYIYNNINKKFDGGALLEDGFEFVQKTGAVEERYWPYLQNHASDPVPAPALTASHYKISAWQKINPAVDEVKNILAKKIPVIIALTIFNSFMSAQVANTGIVPAPGKSETVVGGHAICLVGFDDDKKQLKFRNSWGSGWGDKGYFYISYGTMEKLNFEAYTITYP
jgi:C1A family cysteine protease